MLIDVLQWYDHGNVNDDDNDDDNDVLHWYNHDNASHKAATAAIVVVVLESVFWKLAFKYSSPRLWSSK